MRVDELDSALRQMAAAQAPVNDGRERVVRRARRRRRRQAVVVVLTAAVVVTAVVAWPPWQETGGRVEVATRPSAPATSPASAASVPSGQGLSPGEAASLCFPALEGGPSTPLPSPTGVDGWPQDVPPLMALTGNGDVWAIADGRATRWTTGRHEGAAATGYAWAQWAADGTILASRVVDSPRLDLERLAAPGNASVVASLPYTVKADAPAGYCPIDGYLAGFAVTPDGLVLARHHPGPVPHSCPPAPFSTTTDPWRCASRERVSFEVRSGDYTVPGRGLGLSMGGAAEIVGAAAASGDVLVERDGSLTVVAASGAPSCCLGGQEATAAALSADGSRLAYSPDARTLRIADLAAAQTRGTSLWVAPSPIDALAWTGDRIAVAHGARLTLVSTVDGTARTLAGPDLGAVRTLDFYM